MDKPSEVPAVAHDAPDLGELDNYGVQGENPQANAAVALWGGVHDPSIIGETASPVLLVHGTADSTVLFKTGRPLGNLANTLGVNMMMLKLAGINSISINTPTLYGSFVVDSVLKAKDVEHETYFVDDMPHEFYDEDGYGVKVREKVFAFLYGLTQKNKFSVGEEIEIMKPDGRNILTTVRRIVDADGNEMESCPHPKQQIYVDLGEALSDYDILRRKAAE
jgi:hypothetical protein